MPYASNADLPDAVKKLSSSLQTAWRKTFNSAYDSYNGDEKKAFATAWAQVNKMKESQSFHPSFLRVLDLFLNRYGEEAGRDKFDYFVHRNGLNTARPYDPRAQFSEAFSWAEPYIRLMKADKEAKWYAIRALHAIVSLNNNNYTDLEKMDRAAMSMNYRPLNYNHDHNRWIPYPRTRVDYAKSEDMSVELILRVDNQDSYLQKQLDHDKSIPEKEWINHPSIEGRPLIGGEKEGYHFTALALLEKGYQLPGDPLSEITPIMFEGMQGGQVCLMVDGEKVCLECEEAINEATRSDEERAMSHFNISSEDWAKLSPEKKTDYIKKLPPRGTASNTTSKEGTKIKEVNMGEINKEGAICPNCGHVVDTEGIENPSEIECPNCGANMTSRPAKTVETVNNPEGDTNTMSSSTEDTPKEISEEIKALIANHEAILAKEREEAATATLKIQRELESTKNALRIREDTIINLNERIAELEKASANYTGVQAEVVELTEKVAKVKNEIKDYKEKLATAQIDITTRDSEIDTIKKKVERLEGLVESSNGEVTKWKRMYDNRSVEISEALEKSTLNSQKAVNAMREKSEIQTDNAELREQIAKLTKDYSDIAQKRHADATKILQLEKVNAAIEESKRKLEEAHKEKQGELLKTLEEAKKFHSWAWGKLKDAGYAIVSE